MNSAPFYLFHSLCMGCKCFTPMNTQYIRTISPKQHTHTHTSKWYLIFFVQQMNFAFICWFDVLTASGRASQPASQQPSNSFEFLMFCKHEREKNTWNNIKKFLACSSALDFTFWSIKFLFSHLVLVWFVTEKNTFACY